MARISVNPNAEVGGFVPVQAGTYTLRIEGFEERTSKEGKPYLSWRMAITTPKDGIIGTDGQALSGNPASVFYSTRTDEEAQGMLRGLVEKVLGEWREFDTDELVGKEVEATLKEDTYAGNVKNVVGRILRAL